MKKVKLTPGGHALVDDVDFEYVSRWKWKQHKDGYAVRNSYRGPIYMHRLINRTPSGLQTDHINRNGLDNRRSNLRAVNHSQNAFNTGLWRHNTSGHKGVTWNKNRGKWQAQISIDKKTVYLGSFFDLAGAVSARKRAEEIYYAV